MSPGMSPASLVPACTAEFALTTIKAAPAAPRPALPAPGSAWGGPLGAPALSRDDNDTDQRLSQCVAGVSVFLALDCPARGHHDPVGGRVAPPPPTPPDMRARIRRFGKPSD